MRMFGAFVLPLLLTASSAFAGGRLGHFDGAMSSVNAFGKPHGVPQALPTEAPASAQVQFQLNKQAKRLYVTIAPRNVVGRWRQSFLIQSDEMQADGSRIISYRRPDRGSRSERFNERKHNGAMPKELSFNLAHMQGQGKIVVSPTGQVTWLNDGIASIMPKAEGERLVLVWNETFRGKRARKAR
jgi:hypothetical protein